MFALTDHHEGLGFARTAPPQEVAAPHVREEELRAFRPARFFRHPHLRRRRRRHEDDYAEQINDASIVVNLAWEARNPGDPSCPRSKHELRQRLGLTRPEALQHELPSERKEITVEGIGRMPVSDASSDEAPTVENDWIWPPSCDESHDAWSTTTLSDESDASSVQTSSDCNKERQASSSSFLDQGPKKRKFKRESVQGGPRDTSKKGARRQSTQRHRDPVNVLPAYRVANTTFLIKNPVLLSQSLLFHLVYQALATHQFSDATQLMSLYLVSFSRPAQIFTNTSDLRLYKRFFRATPDMYLSNMHQELLESCYGNPSFLRHDVLYDITLLYCARRQSEKALEFIKRVSSGQYGNFETVYGTLHSCSAIAIYTIWLLRQLKPTDRFGRHEGRLLVRHLFDASELQHFRRELDSASLRTWETRQVLPTLVLRLLASVYIPNDIDKILSIIEDNLAVDAAGLDFLELKVLLLQRRSRVWNKADYLSNLIYGNDELDRLIQTTLTYIDCARGEPGSLTLAVQAFDTFPLADRLSCLFRFLRSNPYYGPAWRLLVENTLGFLGQEYALNACGTLWQLVDETITPFGKVHWQRSLYNARRGLLLKCRAGDRILPFLVTPFFQSDWNELVQLASMISEGFRTRRSSLIRPTSETQFTGSFTIPGQFEPSKLTMNILTGFEALLTWTKAALFQKTDLHSSPRAATATTALNRTELSLLTEAALLLNPSPTIAQLTYNPGARAVG